MSGNEIIPPEPEPNNLVEVYDIELFIPTNISSTINPNSKVEDFSYDNFSIGNCSSIPIQINLETVNINGPFTNIIKPDELPEGKEWNNLNLTESSTYFSLGLLPDYSSDWSECYLKDYIYSSEIFDTTPLGVLEPSKYGSILLKAYHGNSFKANQSFSFDIVFSATKAPEEFFIEPIKENSLEEEIISEDLLLEDTVSIVDFEDTEPTLASEEVVVSEQNILYEVQFYAFNDILISNQLVLSSTSAIAPSMIPEPTGYYFIGWDQEFDCVTCNMTIRALYAPVSPSDSPILDFSPSA